jgi:hypothetical protein
MTTYNSMAEEAEFREYVANMTQKRTPEIVKSNPFDRTSPFYTKYLEMVRSAVIKFKTENPSPSQALIFYSFFYENGIQPADNSIILRVQHGNEFHQFHVQREDLQSFEFWRHNILSTSRAVDRRTEYSATYSCIHMLTCSTGDATLEFLNTVDVQL